MEAYPNGQESSFVQNQNAQRKISQNSSNSCHSTTAVKESRPDSRSPEQNGDQEWVSLSLFEFEIWSNERKKWLEIYSFGWRVGNIYRLPLRTNERVWISIWSNSIPTRLWQTTCAVENICPMNPKHATSTHYQRHSYPRVKTDQREPVVKQP